ncbi:MAG: protocatechuate 3,4-dioxygenase [Pigmentiphaga sp.]
MARIVAAFGSSHSIMLTSTRENWQHDFVEADKRNPFLFDREGKPLTYDDLLARAPADSASRVTPELMGERYDRAEAAIAVLRERIRAARLDVLFIVGDDQTELFRLSNMPALAVFYGKTIRNTVAQTTPGDTWVKTARMRRHEPDGDREYPVDAAFAEWLVRALCDREFDVAAMGHLEPGQFEGHAFQFVHRRYLDGLELPVVPIILNTFDPPNQPTPRRCVRLGEHLRELIAAYPKDLRVGLIASGGLSHFVVDEELDHGVIDAIRRKDHEWLAGLSPGWLKAGSSEIRNWLTVASAARDLDLEHVDYIPGYRTPALSGTGLCFASWKPLS